MKKKFLLTIAAVAAIAVGVVGMSAFEAHVINVTATIENALFVPIEELDFGTVFPEEVFEQSFGVSLSQSFVEAAETTGYQWAATVENYTPGLTKGGNALPGDRNDSNKALGEAEDDDTYNFVSLGFGGTLILGFNHYIVNGSGADVEIWVTETSFGDPSCASYPEKIKVYASKYGGSDWTLLGEAGCLDSEFDLLGLAWAKYLKLVDVSDANDFSSGAADGYEVDGVKATSRERLGTVNYVLRQKPKCVDDSDPSIHPQVTHDGDAFECPIGSTMMPLLCPYLSKSEETEDGEGENDGNPIAAFHGPLTGWTMIDTEEWEVHGKLSVPVEDLNDEWLIDLHVPCFEDYCAQDGVIPPEYQADIELESEIFGCDLWLEVTGIDEENEENNG